MQDWEVFDRQNWHCADCQRPCRKLDETQETFDRRIETDHPTWLRHLYREIPDPEYGPVGIFQIEDFELQVLRTPAGRVAVCRVCAIARKQWAEHIKPTPRQITQLSLF